MPKSESLKACPILVCNMPKGIPWALLGEYEIVFPVKTGLKKVRIEDLKREIDSGRITVKK